MRVMLSDRWQQSGRVFTTSVGTTLDPDNLWRDMARICKAAEVRELTVHALRHTYASIMLARRVPPEVVSKQLGHSTVAFTLSQYRHVYQGERQEWALSLSEVLPPIAVTEHSVFN